MSFGEKISNFLGLKKPEQTSIKPVEQKKTLADEIADEERQKKLVSPKAYEQYKENRAGKAMQQSDKLNREPRQEN